MEVLGGHQPEEVCVGEYEDVEDKALLLCVPWSPAREETAVDDIGGAQASVWSCVSRFGDKEGTCVASAWFLTG